MKKILCLLTVLSVSLLNAQTSREVQALQEILIATNATWTAAENEVTRMSADEQEKLFGLLPGIGDLNTFKKMTFTTIPVRASRFETAHTGIKNQGSCGSCYSFGACATYEGWKLTSSGQSNDLSEQWFMMKAKAIGPYGGCSGWYLDTSMQLMQDNAIPNESQCTYKATETSCGSITGSHQIGGFTSTTDPDTIKNALQNGPVYTGFAVYSDFMSYSGGVYRYKSGSLRGYHAVCIVGYDDSTNSWKVKNSWGTGWGEGGYFRIGYDQMTNSVQFGTCFGGSFYITE